jgi:hypothetical protein
MIGPVLGEEWNPDLIGMNCLRVSQSWDVGGPVVFHSEWWLRAHWGRAFDILQVDDNYINGHAFVLLRKRDVKLTDSDLEAIEAGEPREIDALRHNIVQLHTEEELLRRALLEERTLRASAESAYDAERKKRIGSRSQALGSKLTRRISKSQ